MERLKKNLIDQVLNVFSGPKSYGLVRGKNRWFLRNYHRELKSGKGLTYSLAYARLIGLDMNRFMEEGDGETNN